MANYEQLADYYEQEALRTFGRRAVLWSDDEGMLDMFRGDYNDHLTVAEYVRAGQLDRARHYLWRMDTAAREECPDAWRAPPSEECPDKVYAVLYPDY